MIGLKKDMKRSKILITDDSKLEASMLHDIVKDMGHIPVISYSPYDGLKILKNENIDLILLDVVMGGIDGYKFMEIVKSQIEEKFIPVIFVTSLDSVENLVEGLDLGAMDYIRKPFVPQEVMARINVALRIKNLHDSLIEANKKLKDMVIRDSLTNLYNHRYIVERLREEFRKVKGSNYTSAYIIIDIDKFKNINDTYGHLAGDSVLIKLSNILIQELGDLGCVGRYGGEEFSLILIDTNREKVSSFAKKVLEKVRETPFFYDPEDKEAFIKITISMGIALFPEDCRDFLYILKNADNALYKAKEWGRDVAVCYNRGRFVKL